MKEGLISLIVTFFVVLAFSPLIIKLVRAIKGKQSILSYVDKHKSKEGTLTLGGLIFLFAGIVAYLIFLKSNNLLAGICLVAFLSYGLLGFLDDFIKMKRKDNSGLKPYQKLIGQFGIAIILAFFIYNSLLIGDGIRLPISQNMIKIGAWIIPFVVVYYLAVTNSVNLLDGLDGLAGGTSLIILIVIFVVLGIDLTRLEGVGERAEKIAELANVLSLTGGVVGGLLVFLCYNSFPAKIFMGDTGSLALGGFIATVLAFTNNYLLILIVGFMLVITTVSVIMQVGYYKLTKKRIFKMTPIHHHFELKGSNETKIVAIYIIITIVLGAVTILLSI